LQPLAKFFQFLLHFHGSLHLLSEPKYRCVSGPEIFKLNYRTSANSVPIIDSACPR